MIQLYGIVYGDKQTEFTPYRNNFTTNLHRFENNPMIDIIDNKLGDLADGSLLGIFSWKFTRKTGIAPEMIYSSIIQDEADVYNCSRWSHNLHFMDWSEEGHAGIKYFIQKCCEHTGLKYNNDCEHVFFANQFVTTKRIYTDYVNRIIKPSLELLEGELWEKVNVPAGYTAGLELNELKRLTGLDFYNYVPFVLERMFMQYVDNNNFKILNV